jgi:hypothetical protein
MRATQKEFEMELSWVPWLIVWGVSLIVFSLVLWLVLRSHRATTMTMLRSFSSLTATNATAAIRSIEMAQKLSQQGMAMAKAGDLWTYQGIVAMETPGTGYDPGQRDLAEQQELQDQELSEDLNGHEAEALQELFDAPGNEFVGFARGDEWRGSDYPAGS